VKLDLWTPTVFKAAMQQSQLTHEHILQETSDTDVLALAEIYQIHKRLHKFGLPINLQIEHFQLMQKVQKDIHGSCILHRTQLYLCLQCNRQNNTSCQNMRYHFQHDAICSNCLQSDFVVKVNTLGHLVRANQNYYYYCQFCQNVHLWQSTGLEFCRCQHAKSKVQNNSQQHCAVCYRCMQLFKVQFLDSKLGVMQNFSLCAKHMPTEAQLRYVHDIQALSKLIKYRN
jgi:hypothetical protein